MKTIVKILLVSVLFGCGSAIASAHRGGMGRKRSKIHLNIVTLNNLRQSIHFNLKSGLNYRGSFQLDQQQIGNSIFNSQLLSYKKGNTIYIMPYKQKILIPDFNPSTGYKLIIRPK